MTMIIRMLSPRCDRTFWYYIEVYYFCSFFVFKLGGIIIYQIIKHLFCWLQRGSFCVNISLYGGRSRYPSALHRWNIFLIYNLAIKPLALGDLIKEIVY